MLSLLPFSLLSLLAINYASTPVDATSLPFKVRTKNPLATRTPQPAPRRSLFSRGPDSIIPVHNTHNAEYISNITLGGRQIPVLLDTGSSDLWVTGNVPNTKDLGKAVSLNYAVGNAHGDVHTADLQFAGYTVKDQAYLLVEDVSSFKMDIKAQGFEGLIGLGPNSGSTILDKIDDKSANSVLDRIFSQNTTTANYLTMLLDRLGDHGSNITGTLTVSELAPGYEKIATMPKLPVDKVHRLTDADQHWQVYTDPDGVIGPDGLPIKVKSIVPSAPDNQLVAVFDSGYTFPQVPREMADAIYGRVPGAVYNEVSEIWTVPCGQLINLSFKFGGYEFPVHPLDVSSSDFNMVDATGNPVCVGSFQPITSAFSLLGEYDIILGMGFMRNVYTLLDYGDWIKDSSVDRNPPFIQLLSVTDRAAAKQDFINTRLAGVDSTNDPAYKLLPPDQMQHSPISSEEKKKKYEEKVLSRWPYILVGCLAFVLIIIGVITWRCCLWRKRRNARKANTAAALGISTRNTGSEPAYPMHAQGGGSSPMYKSQYSMDDPYGFRGSHKV
ncbi:aspartic peptidase A1 [Cristinia sonorae]|uniref:Aspartic peptidase A1 n=1 Tax=Cristinia sonorae TaxID=1940300 RepID=A0A8K0XKG6_9AGAR|nr:aspartic peptidase A1 [Cristinia sonorae]